MKVRKNLKLTIHFSFWSLFVTGAAYFIFEKFFQTMTEFGPTQHPMQIWSLRAHSILGLWFMIFFGYLYSVHIAPSLRKKKKRKTGYPMLFLFVALFISVPALFYFTNEAWRLNAALFHTILGFAIPISFILHILLK